jgi:hypothetical protein
VGVYLLKGTQLVQFLGFGNVHGRGGERERTDRHVYLRLLGLTGLASR